MQRYLVGISIVLVMVFGYLYLSSDVEVAKVNVGDQQTKPSGSVPLQGSGDKWWLQKADKQPTDSEPNVDATHNDDATAEEKIPIRLQEDISPEQWNAQFKDEPTPDMADLDTPSIVEIMSEPEIEPQPTLAPPPYEASEGYQQDINDSGATAATDAEPINANIDNLNAMDAGITDNMMMDDGTGVNMMIDDGTSVNMMMDDGVEAQGMMMDDGITVDATGTTNLQ